MKECPTCGESRNQNDFSWSVIDLKIYEATGQEVWIKPTNPNQCKYCEWGSEV